MRWSCRGVSQRVYLSTFALRGNEAERSGAGIYARKHLRRAALSERTPIEPIVPSALARRRRLQGTEARPGDDDGVVRDLKRAREAFQQGDVEASKRAHVGGAEERHTSGTGSTSRVRSTAASTASSRPLPSWPAWPVPSFRAAPASCSCSASPTWWPTASPWPSVTFSAPARNKNTTGPNGGARVGGRALPQG